MVDKITENRLKKEQLNKQATSLQTQKSTGRSCIKSHLLKGLCILSSLLGCYQLGIFGYQKYEDYQLKSAQEKISEQIKSISDTDILKIRRAYDTELLSLIMDYETGKKLNGFKMSPKNAVFAAHSDLLYKYNAYNPDVYKNYSPKEWILLEHMAHRYYQYVGIKLSNRQGDKNSYTDILQQETQQPIVWGKRFSSGKWTHFTEALKLNNVMSR